MWHNSTCVRLLLDSDSNFAEVWSPSVPLTISQRRSSCNGLAPNRRLAIIWTDNGPVYWHIWVTQPKSGKRENGMAPCSIPQLSRCIQDFMQVTHTMAEYSFPSASNVFTWFLEYHNKWPDNQIVENISAKSWHMSWWAVGLQIFGKIDRVFSKYWTLVEGIQHISKAKFYTYTMLTFEISFSTYYKLTFSNTKPIQRVKPRCDTCFFLSCGLFVLIGEPPITNDVRVGGFPMWSVVYTRTFASVRYTDSRWHCDVQVWSTSVVGINFLTSNLIKIIPKSFRVSISALEINKCTFQFN